MDEDTWSNHVPTGRRHDASVPVSGWVATEGSSGQLLVSSEGGLPRTEGWFSETRRCCDDVPAGLSSVSQQQMSPAAAVSSWKLLMPCSEGHL